MRTECNIRPPLLSIERNADGTAELIFCENVRELQGDGEEAGDRYEYDEYRLTLPFREGLSAIVQAAPEAWLSKAKDAEADTLAAEIRKRRDRLLRATDAEMALDRMGLTVPSGTGLPDWLSFLRGLGNALSGELAQYRQALRDVPQQPGFPYEINWPARPGNRGA